MTTPRISFFAKADIKAGREEPRWSFHHSQNIFRAPIAKGTDTPLAFIAGGETVVRLTGKGGLNQELALAAANDIAGMTKAAVFSVGSDGTDARRTRLAAARTETRVRRFQFTT